MVENVLLLAVLGLIIGLAVRKIIVEKKKGTKCIGCSSCVTGCKK